MGGCSQARLSPQSGGRLPEGHRQRPGARLAGREHLSHLLRGGPVAEAGAVQEGADALGKERGRHREAARPAPTALLSQASDRVPRRNCGPPVSEHVLGSRGRFWFRNDLKLCTFFAFEPFRVRFAFLVWHVPTRHRQLAVAVPSSTVRSALTTTSPCRDPRVVPMSSARDAL